MHLVEAGPEELELGPEPGQGEVDGLVGQQGPAERLAGGAVLGSLPDTGGQWQQRLHSRVLPCRSEQWITVFTPAAHSSLSSWNCSIW